MHDFSMRGGIVRSNRLIESAPDDKPIFNNNRADRHFAQIPGMLSLNQRCTHEGFIQHRLASASGHFAWEPRRWNARVTHNGIHAKTL